MYSPRLVVDQPLSVTPLRLSRQPEWRQHPHLADFHAGAILELPRAGLVRHLQRRDVVQAVRDRGDELPGARQHHDPAVRDPPMAIRHSAYDQNRGKITWRSWQGSLPEWKRDRSGLDYRRARVYDRETGRFTQEDPLGLAGGPRGPGACQPRTLIISSATRLERYSADSRTNARLGTTYPSATRNSVVVLAQARSILPRAVFGPGSLPLSWAKE